jgi:U4/U6 small nuclear ribonucleoprotein PRP4
MGELSSALANLLSVTTTSHSYQIATGAGDDTIRIWDMRSLKALYTIPAHKSNVSDVRFFRASELPVTAGMEVDVDGAHDTASGERYKSGLYLASAGYDGLVKIWSADDWQLQRSLPTDAGKVMSVDISGDAKFIASGSYNRSYQLFAPGEVTA